MADKQKQGVEYEGTVPLESVISYLDDLRARLASGEVQVENGSRSMLLEPAASIRLRVRAREKDSSQSLRFEMEWERSEAPEAPQALAFKAPNGTAPVDDSAEAGTTPRRRKKR